jgi:hypothetical protein
MCSVAVGQIAGISPAGLLRELTIEDVPLKLHVMTIERGPVARSSGEQSSAISFQTTKPARGLPVVHLPSQSCR